MTLRKENPRACPTEACAGIPRVEFYKGEPVSTPVASYLPARMGVTLSSENSSLGSVSFNDPESMRAARDGLIEACEHFGIK